MTQRILLLLLALSAATAPAARAQTGDAFTSYLNAYDLREITVDGSGTAWIATNGGVLELDLGTRAWTTHPARRAGGLVGNDISTIVAAPDGSVWAGTADRGVSVYDPLLRRWSVFEEVPDPRIRVIRFAGTRLLIGTENGLALRLQSQRTDICNDIALGCIVPSYEVNDYAMVGDTLWVATEAGLGRFDGESWNEPDALPAGSTGHVARSLAVHGGELWEATPGSVRRLTGGAWTAFSLDADRLVVDAGRLFALAGGGVREWTGSEWTALSIPVPEGFTVRDLALDAGFFLLAGQGGLALWSEGSGELAGFLVPPGPQVADFHRGIAVDSDCTVWVGNQEGLLNFDGESWTLYPKGTRGLDGQWIFSVLAFGDRLAVGHCCCFGAPNCRLDVLEGETAQALAAYDVYTVAVDDAGRLWAATDAAGVYVFAPTGGGGYELALHLDNATTGGALRSNSIRALVVTADGTYFGHRQSLGVDYWPHHGNIAVGADGSTWKSIQVRNGLYDGSVSSMAAQGSDVWVGTSTALHRVREGIFLNGVPTRKPDVAGDLSRIVQAIVPDDQGGIWCGTDNGLLRLRSTTADEFEYYDTSNSDLPTDNLLSGALSPCDGLVWLGGLEGIVSVDPRKLTGTGDEREEFVLHPNPFNPAKDRRRVFIGYAVPDVIPAGARITGAEVFDITGRSVGRFESIGEEWTWNGTNVNGDLVVPGVYVVVVDSASGGRTVLKLGVIR